MKESDRNTKIRCVEIQCINSFKFSEIGTDKSLVSELAGESVFVTCFSVQLNTSYGVHVMPGIRFLERFSHALEITWYKMEIKSRRYTLWMSFLKATTVAGKFWKQNSVATLGEV